MPRQSASGDPVGNRADRRQVASRYTSAEWRVLTRLPGQVVVAAVLIGRAEAGRAGNPRRTVGCGLAGLEGIAAGRAFDSDLVRAVADGIYAEVDDEGPQRAGPEPVVLIEVYAACRAAARLLAGRADPADSAAYCQWVQSVAARVCRAARPGGLSGGEPVTPRQRRFLDDLGVALGLR